MPICGCLSRIQTLLASSEELSLAFAELGLSGSQFQRIVDGAHQLTAARPNQSSQQSAELIQGIVRRVIVQEATIEVELDIARLAAKLDANDTKDFPAGDSSASSVSRTFRTTCQLQLLHRRGELRLIVPSTAMAAQAPNGSLVRAIARSQRWKQRIITGEIFCKQQLATEANLNASYIGRILRLSVLSPDTTDSLIRHHALSNRSLTRRVVKLPLDWVVS